MKTNGECESCPEGTDCSRVGTTLASLNNLEGWYRFDVSSTTVYECPNQKNCVGGEIESDKPGATSPCKKGSGGALCAICGAFERAILCHLSHTSSGQLPDRPSSPPRALHPQTVTTS